jgi:DivIVA domain-containing protein
VIPPVRRLIQFLFPRPTDRPPRTPPRQPQALQRRSPNGGAYFRSATPLPLTAGQVRDRQFTAARRGVDPDEVQAFLHRVARELAAVRAELIATRDENLRLKNALRDWQSRFVGRARV